MANPQVENGYTKISNETMDALCVIRIPGQARQVLDFILRKTYGWNKKTDQISLSQFVGGTGLSKVAVCKSLNILIKINIITKQGNALSLFTQKGNDKAVTYGFQKDYTKWSALPKKITLPKKVKHVTQKGNKTLPKKVPTKDTITKDTITKEIYTDKQKTFVGRYIKYISEKYTTRSPKKLNLEKNSLETIGKLIRIDGFQEDYIFEVLRWAGKDDFWQDQVLSLAKLRKLSQSNGLKKFQNLANGYEKYQKAEVTAKPENNAGTYEYMLKNQQSTEKDLP